MGGQLLAPHLLDIEYKDREAPAPGDLRVLLAQRTGSGVAGVFEGSGALQFLLGTEMPECLVGHIDLAAHLEKLGGILQLLRDFFDGPDIGSDILAHHAVASGGSTHQLPVLVLEAARKTVDLDLDHILRFNACIPHSAVKITQFIVGKCIQQALHLDRMGHFLEAAAGRSADVLGGRSGRDQLGVLRFQLLQLPGQGVVFEVLQLGGILIVIKAVILLDNSAQFLDALSGLFQFHSSTLLPDTASRPRLISHAIVYHKTGHFVNEKTELPSPFCGEMQPCSILAF